ncbi:metal-dependent hydrolase [Halorussus halobius]|uniref:metal-dependent hydrolase n=1 Tax=Halorussus halobius TaxID=1710537 RepID=UPI001092AA1D|nr:metal-dependent hydrolase [Halorussus halobius]
MWPWEHLAVGYLGYSLAVHLLGRRAPGDAAVVALAVGTQFPDLVDKPLAWGPGVLPSGYSLGHSAFAAVPLTLLAVAVAYRLGRAQVGVAFGFGYLSHLPGDVVYPWLTGGDLAPTILLWPLVPASDAATGTGLLEAVRTLVGRYGAELASGDLGAYLAIEVGLLASVLVVWLLDGTPPLRAVWSRIVGPGAGEETS